MEIIPLHMAISGVIWFEKSRFNKKYLPLKMPKKMRMKIKCFGLYCNYCKKIMKKEEVKLHYLVCEKVPQEMLNHFKTPLGGSSVSFGTNCNSSLTNPLLGAPLLK